MRRHPAGVTIVTLDSENGPVGFTATSFASLSMNPPLISFNIALNSSSIMRSTPPTRCRASARGAPAAPLAAVLAQRRPRFSDESLWSRLETGEPCCTAPRSGCAPPSIS
ncbi:hypothetical protein GS887_28015 [Rhodococcus hoagii]|nr:hypothetical protein [Prescottella equi]